MGDKKLRQRIGWILLGVAFILGCLTAYWGLLPDEADNLVGGLLLACGQVLYRDFFSHHFPLPYYWTAAVIGLFGKSILAARLSVWVFQIAAIGIAMRLSRFYLALGLASLIWSIAHHLYKANMVLYSPFAGASLVAVFAVTLAVVLETTDTDWKQALAVGFFSTTAIMSDPLSVYAVAVCLLFLLVRKPRLAFLAISTAASLVIGYMLYLVLSGTIRDFVDKALLFNAQVYAKYTYANPLRLRDMWTSLRTGLGILDHAWLNFDPLRPISSEYTQIDRWAFTGLLYRLAFLVGTVYLLLLKRLLAASFLYLFAAAVLVIAPWDFRAAGFVLASLVTLSALILQEWQPTTKTQARPLVQQVITVALGLVVVWLGVRILYHTFVENPDGLQSPFSNYETVAEGIREITCNQELDVLLGWYPGGTYHYWFTEMTPVSGYLYLYPWVAEVGLSEIIHRLGGEQVLAFVVVDDELLWDRYETRDYLGDLIDYLDENYIEIASGMYVSPLLADRCGG